MNGIEKFQELAKISDQDKDIRRGVLRNIVTAEILQAMDSLGISKSELAAKLNCTKGHISRMLSGDRNLTLDSISDIAVALGITISFSTGSSKKRGKPNGCLEFVYNPHRITYSEEDKGIGYSYHTECSDWSDRQAIEAVY